MNICGINNNVIYLNKLIEQYDIICIQETWATDKSKLTSNLLTDKMKIYHKEAKKIAITGRPSGGIGFLVDKKYKCKVQFYGDRVGVIKLNKFAIITCYMICDNNTQTNLNDYLIELDVIQSLYRHLTTIEKMEVIIMGDLNVDLRRNTLNTYGLKMFMKMTTIRSLEPININIVDYTYSKIVNNHMIKSRIDHILARDDSSVPIYDAKIIKDEENLGDHNLISAKYMLLESDSFNTPFNKPKIKRPSINWGNPDERHEYSVRVGRELVKLNHKIERLNGNIRIENLKSYLSNIINEITSVLFKSLTKAENEIQNRKKAINKHKKAYKSWWDADMKILHQKVVNTYIKYKEDNFSNILKIPFYEAKREFRIKKRQKLNERRHKNIINFNKIFSKNKNQFWRYIKTMKKKIYQ